MRRSKLYYLRKLSGRKARLHSKVRDLSGLISDEARDASTAGNAAAVADATAVEEADEQATQSEGVDEVVVVDDDEVKADS